VKVFLDTSVLVAAVLEEHEAHERSLAVLDRVQSKRDEGYLSGHGLAEVYSVLTRLPPPSRHTPEQALVSIEENFINNFHVAGLTGGEYGALIRDAALRGISGGTIYDAVLLRTAELARVDRIYTWNLKHFQAVAQPATAALLRTP